MKKILIFLFFLGFITVSLNAINISKAFLSTNTYFIEQSNYNLDKPVDITLNLHTDSLTDDYANLRFGIETKEGNIFPLLVWNSDKKKFDNSIDISNINPEIDKSVSLSLILTQDSLKELSYSITSETGMLVKILCLINNTQVSDVVSIYLAKINKNGNFAENKINFEKSYSKNFSSKYFGSGFSGSSSSSINTEKASFDVDAKVKITIFKKDFTFLNAYTDSLADPYNISNSHLDMGLEFLGIELWGAHKKATFNYEREISYTKTIKKSADFTVGPIPLTVTGGATGTVGFNFNVEISTIPNGLKFYPKAGPFASIGAFARAGVGSSKVASAGIAGKLFLIRDHFWGKFNASLIKKESSGLQGDYNYKIVNYLKGADGKFGIYVKYANGVKCKCKKKKLGVCIKYKCHTKYKRKYKWLTDWDGWKKNFTLLDKKNSFDF